MTKKSIALGAALITLGVLSFGTQKAFAYRGDPTVQGPNYTEERHQAMTQALENNDYNAWKELMGDRGRVTQVINEGNFARFAEAHKLALEGKTEEARTIREELGLGLRDGSGQGQGNGLKNGSGNCRW